MRRTRPERVVGGILRRLFPGEVGEQARDLPGTPDFVLRRRRVAVFVHGCFWHGCPRCYTEPRRNVGFWRRKLRRNRARDARAEARLRARGWRVVVIWEHEIEDTRRIAEAVSEQISFRRHQAKMNDLCEEILSGVSQGKIIAHVVPGGGKSLLPVIAAARLIPTKADALCWIVPRKSLRKQAAETFDKDIFRRLVGHDLRIMETVNEGNPARGLSGYVTTYQALGCDKSRVHLNEFMRRRMILVLDEFHHLHQDAVAAAAVEPLIERAALVIGMTGHVYRHDKSQRIPLLDYGEDKKVIRDDWVEYSIIDGMRDGVLRVPFFEYHDGRAAWRTVEKAQIQEAESLGDGGKALFAALNKEYAEGLLSYAVADWRRRRRIFPTAKLLVVCGGQFQARSILRVLRSRSARYRSDIAISDEPDSHLKITEFRDGKLDILVTVAMCYEGMDVPSITHIACLTWIRSRSWIEQMFGRAWRVDPTMGPPHKQPCRIFVPIDRKMVRIVEGLKDLVNEALREKGTAEGPRPEGDRIMPIRSELTDRTSGDMDGFMDEDPVFRRVVEEMDLPMDWWDMRGAYERVDDLRRHQGGTISMAKRTAKEELKEKQDERSSLVRMIGKRLEEDWANPVVNPYQFLGTELNRLFGRNRDIDDEERAIQWLHKKYGNLLH